MNRVQPFHAPAGARIFIVEDEALIAMELADRLESMGFTPCGHANAGERALPMIVTARPHVVLMDINLGGALDGIDTARLLQREMDVPVVFLTAYFDAELVASASDVSAFGYLSKPYNDRDLNATLVMALGRHAATRELRQANQALSAAMTRVRQLRGLLAICSACKKIRDHHHEWHRLEAYITAHSDADFTHGYCPQCFETASQLLDAAGPRRHVA